MNGSEKLFQLGDMVEWTSQAAGRTKIKVGKIIAVIAPNETPFLMSAYQKSYKLPNGLEISYWKTNYGGGLPRNFESYVVEVGNGKAYYWPRVSGLRRHEEKSYILCHESDNTYMGINGLKCKKMADAKVMGFDEARKKSQGGWQAFEAIRIVMMKQGKKVDFSSY